MIYIVDYGLGNLGSVLNMLNKIGIPAEITGDPAVLKTAERIILPGVGSFDKGMQNLEKSGLLEVLKQKVIDDKVPLLGICLGMQLLLESSEEGKEAGLGWIPGKATRFRFSEENQSLKVPHMGWNYTRACGEQFLFAGEKEKQRFYFVHSYHAQVEEQYAMAKSSYGYEFTCAIRRDNIMGVQFHPEKSHSFGMKLLKSFAEEEF